MASIILDRIQAGIETVVGTPVAATRKVYAHARSRDYQREPAARTDVSGTFFGRRQPSYPRAANSLSFTEVLSFETAPWWGRLLWKGPVAPTSDAGTPPAYTYDQTPTPGADDLASATIEGWDRDTPYRFAQFMPDTWSLAWDSDSTQNPDWILTASGPTLAPAQQAITGAIGDIARELVPARGTKVYLDTAAGTIGTTQLLGQAISGTINGTIGREFLSYAENEFGPAPGKTTRGDYVVTGSLVVAFLNDTEFANFRADQPQSRKIRLVREGSVVHGTPEVKKKFQFDILAAFYTSIPEGERGRERTLTLNFEAYWDIAAAASFKPVTVNSLATLV